MIIFVVGGISYSELRAIRSINNNNKTVILAGGTSIINPDEFIEELIDLE